MVEDISADGHRFDGTNTCIVHHSLGIQLINTVMKTVHLIFSALVFLTFSIAAPAQTIFDQNFTGTQKEQFSDGKPKYEVNVVKGKKQGLETFWYASGQLYIQTHYVDDKEDGVWKQWYENGQLKLEANYKGGREHGSFTQWYENGQMRVQSNFVDGKKEGMETAWNKDGSVKYKSLYADGQEVRQQ